MFSHNGNAITSRIKLHKNIKNINMHCFCKAVGIIAKFEYITTAHNNDGNAIYKVDSLHRIWIFTWMHQNLNASNIFI